MLNGIRQTGPCSGFHNIFQVDRHHTGRTNKIIHSLSGPTHIVKKDTDKNKTVIFLMERFLRIGKCKENFKV